MYDGYLWGSQKTSWSTVEEGEDRGKISRSKGVVQQRSTGRPRKACPKSLAMCVYLLWVYITYSEDILLDSSGIRQSMASRRCIRPYFGKTRRKDCIGVDGET